MKRLTKYKDGKFLLNHSSMNEAIDKLGKLEIIDELTNKRDYYFKEDGFICKNVLCDNHIVCLSEDGKYLEVLQVKWTGVFEVHFQYNFSEYKKTWSLNEEDLVNDIQNYNIQG